MVILPGSFYPWNRHIYAHASFAFKNDIFYIGNDRTLSLFSSSGILLDYLAPSYSGKTIQEKTVSEYAANNIPYHIYPLEFVGAIGVDKNQKMFFANTLVDKMTMRTQTDDFSPTVQLLMYSKKTPRL